MRSICILLSVLVAALAAAVSGVTGFARPAVAADGTCAGPVTTIGAIQGPVAASPVAGQTRTVRGTVTADDEGPQPALRGFYLQDAGDGDPATSDGIFVFDNGANLVALGEVVDVSGTVSEYQGQTQLTATAAGVSHCGGAGTVIPTDLTLPRTSADDLEPYESMEVRFHQTLSVTETFQLGRFGQVVVSAGGRLRQPTAVLPATDRAGVAALQAANDRNRLIIDDADQAQNPDPIVFGRDGQPLSATNTLRGGDTITDPVGVLTYTWAGNAASGNAFRLRPIGALGGQARFVAADPRPDHAPDVGRGGLRVASANLLNFFNTFTGCTLGVGGAATDCRGANNATEYQRQLAKEVASIRFLRADVVAYMEMENNGYGADSAVQAMVDALNAADGAGTWAFVNPDAATGIMNAAGTDAIKAGLLYRTDRVSAVPGATFADQNAVFERRPVAQTFRTRSGGRVTVVANHFKSKGSCPASGPDVEQGDGQSCWNAHRTAQATELARWLRETVVPAAADPDVLIVGDLNSYAGEDPIRVLSAAGYANLVADFSPGEQPYSYGYDGQWGYLDYQLASASLRPQVTGAGDAHHNADEPSVLDYNTEFKSSGQVASLYAADRFRTSDHDPVLSALQLKPTKVATVLRIASSLNPSPFRRPVTFTATVTRATTGTVTFSARGQAIGAPVRLVGGRAVSRAIALPPGDTRVTARYSGAPDARRSSASLIQRVG